MERNVDQVRTHATVRYLSIAACLVLAQALNHALAVAQVPSSVWVRSYGSDQMMHHAQALTPVPRTNTLLVAGTSSLAGGSGEQGAFWIWEIRRGTGELVREVTIDSGEKDQRIIPTYTYIKSVTVTADNNFLLVAEFRKGDPSLLLIDAQGKLLMKRALDHAPGDQVISKIIPLDDANKSFLLVGRAADNAFVERVDRAGNTIWHKIFDLGQVELFVDGVSLDEGGALLLGNVGAYDASSFSLGKSDIWLVEIDLTGKVKSEEVFAGRHGSIVALPQGHHAVLYDRGKSSTQDIWLSLFDGARQKLWDRAVVSLDHNLSRFRIAALPDGEVVVAGVTASREIWLARISQEGERLWEYAGDAGNKSWDTHGLVSSDGNAFVLTSVYSERSDRKVNFKVGLINLAQE